MKQFNDWTLPSSMYYMFVWENIRLNFYKLSERLKQEAREERNRITRVQMGFKGLQWRNRETTRGRGEARELEEKVRSIETGKSRSTKEERGQKAKVTYLTVRTADRIRYIRMGKRVASGGNGIGSIALYPEGRVRCTYCLSRTRFVRARLRFARICSIVLKDDGWVGNKRKEFPEGQLLMSNKLRGDWDFRLSRLTFHLREKSVEASSKHFRSLNFDVFQYTRILKLFRYVVC